VTNGHVDLIQRSATIFDQVIVAILQNAEKNPLFTVEERTVMLAEATGNLRTFPSLFLTDCWWTLSNEWKPL